MEYTKLAKDAYNSALHSKGIWLLNGAALFLYLLVSQLQSNTSVLLTSENMSGLAALAYICICSLSLISLPILLYLSYAGLNANIRFFQIWHKDHNAKLNFKEAYELGKPGWEKILFSILFGALLISLITVPLFLVGLVLTVILGLGTSSQDTFTNPNFLVFIIWGVLALIAIVPIVLISMVEMFAPMYIVTKKYGVMEAYKASYEYVKSNIGKIIVAGLFQFLILIPFQLVSFGIVFGMSMLNSILIVAIRDSILVFLFIAIGSLFTTVVTIAMTVPVGAWSWQYWTAFFLETQNKTQDK